MQLGTEHCSLQLSPHSRPRPGLQASRYRVVQALVHEFLAASLQSQLPVQLPSSVHLSITMVLQELQELSMLSHSLLHIKRMKASHVE
jgi:hypothetical protein